MLQGGCCSPLNSAVQKMELDADLSVDEIVQRLDALPEDHRNAVIEEILAATADKKFIPNPGPQTEAYFAKADLLLYGGQGGGGKSALIVGLALNEHKRSLILRRKYVDLGAIISDTVTQAGTRKGLNMSAPPQFKTDDGRIIDFGAANGPDTTSTWQGNPHDLIAMDEACQMLEADVRFVMGWNRSIDPDQRCRVVMASNPPLNAEGQWIVGMFRPWLDITYESRAEPGELRWFITDPDGKDMEVGGRDDVREYDGIKYVPKSRTFIPAKLSDNPFLIDTGYQATLDAMPEPLRSAIRDGNFLAAREDDEWQVIPSAWIVAAKERWKAGKPSNAPMNAMGLDVARGGRDDTVLSRRHGTWFDHLIVVAGRDTPDGPSVVAIAAKHSRDGAEIGLDAIGVGGSVQDHLMTAGMPCLPLNGAEGSYEATRDGAYHFATKRSEMWWRLREALDPDYGDDIALPPDPQLLADLAAPTYVIRPGEKPKIYVEGKPDIKRRLGRSPDRGDAVVYCWAVGVGSTRRRSQVLHTPAPMTEYDGFRYSAIGRW